MGTITVNVKDEVEKEFKAVANIARGGEKGYLEKAVTEAMQRWINEKRQEKIAEVTYVEMLDLSSLMDIVIKMEPEDAIKDLEG